MKNSLRELSYIDIAQTMYPSWNLSRILCIENPTFRLRSCVQRNKVIGRGMSLRKDCAGSFCRGCFLPFSLSLSISLCRSSSKACSTLTLLNFVTAISPIRPIALEEKRKVSSRLVSTDEFASVIPRSYFRGYLPGQQPILPIFPCCGMAS